ncbi:MAG: hypothetical protein U0Z26_11120 [Anaerolineales bacterium]
MQNPKPSYQFTNMKKSKLFSGLLIVFLLLFLQATPVSAHPADVYTHAIYIDIKQNAVSVKWQIKPGPILISYIWYQVDVNQDNVVSSDEANQWVSAHLKEFTATLGNANLPLQLDGLQFPSSLDAFQSGQEFITVNLSASWAEDLGDSYRLMFQNNFEKQKSLNWYYLTAEDGIQFQAPNQSNSRIAFQVFPTTAGQATQSKLLTAWDSSMPSLSSWQGGQPAATATPEPAAPTQQQNSRQEMLLNLVRSKQFSLSFYLFALGVSLVLGALHALTPGHGKTVVAAYLVGSRGTTLHAVVLGSVVTLTHTGSVFLLGIITLAASQYILPTSIIPVLEILSGLLIVGLGLYLFWQRFVYWRQSRMPAPQPASRKFSLTPSSQSGKKISGPVKVQGMPANAHHHGDGKIHSHDVPETLTWRSLIALGVSGGLVPCPDAIAILLVAVAINRILLGLALILSFSLGLAVVLILIGLLMVNSRRLFDRVSIFDKLAPIMPIVSAAIVLVLGFGLTWGAYVRAKDSFKLAGAGSSGVNEAQVLYQLEGKDRIKQLYKFDIKTHTSTALTTPPSSVVDYALSSDESKVVYISQTGDADSELWLLDLASGENTKLLTCDNAICSQPVWSPDGSRVIFEHISLDVSNATGLATLWWIDMRNNQAKPLFQEDQLPGANPRWSPDGKWLSYATADNVRLYNLESGESHVVKSILGASAAWSPDGKSVLYRDVVIEKNQFVTQLFVYDLDSKKSTNINPDLGFENILAAWSPDGKSIAVVRRDLSVQRGDQIWLMNADGSNAHAITDTPNVLHGSLNWSDDGKSILYDLYLLDSYPLESKLQMLNVDSGEITDLNVVGYNPRWVWPK